MGRQPHHRPAPGQCAGQGARHVHLERRCDQLEHRDGREPLLCEDPGELPHVGTPRPPAGGQRRMESRRAAVRRGGVRHLHGNAPLTPSPARDEFTPAVLLVKLRVTNPSLKPRQAHVWLQGNDALTELSLENGFIYDRVGGKKLLARPRPRPPARPAGTRGRRSRASLHRRTGGQCVGNLRIPVSLHRQPHPVGRTAVHGRWTTPRNGTGSSATGATQCGKARFSACPTPPSTTWPGRWCRTSG